MLLSFTVRIYRHPLILSVGFAHAALRVWPRMLSTLMTKEIAAAATSTHQGKGILL